MEKEIVSRRKSNRLLELEEDLHRMVLTVIVKNGQRMDHFGPVETKINSIKAHVLEA
jgi:hypothetical protein